MTWSDKNIRSFLDNVCIKYGYCLSFDDKEKIVAMGPMSPDETAKKIISAEGLDPETAVKNYREVRNAYVEYFYENH